MEGQNLGIYEGSLLLCGVPKEYAVQENEVWDDAREAPDSSSASQKPSLSVEEELEATKRQLQAIRAQFEAHEEVLRRRNRQIRDLVTELIFTEQKVRQQVSQILHDELQQLLFAAQVQVQFVKQALTSDHEATARGDVIQIKTMLDEALRITRRLTLDFSPSFAQNQDVADLLEELAAHMSEWHSLKVGLHINVAAEVLGHELPQFIFQVVRELLFNVVKHADVRQAQVEVRTEVDRLLLMVTDEGAGFAAAANWHSLPVEGSYGLRSIYNRIILLGGHMEINSRPEVGTTVTITLPLPHVEE